MTTVHANTLREFIAEAPCQSKAVIFGDYFEYDQFEAWHKKVSTYLRVSEGDEILSHFNATDNQPQRACAILMALVSKHDTSTVESVTVTERITSADVEDIVKARLKEHDKKQDVKRRVGWAVVGMLIGVWLLFKPFGYFAVLSGHSSLWFLVGGAVIGFFMGELLVFFCAALLIYICIGISLT